jgi:hypothetical protein
MDQMLKDHQKYIEKQVNSLDDSTAAAILRYLVAHNEPNGIGMHLTIRKYLEEDFLSKINKNSN